MSLRPLLIGHSWTLDHRPAYDQEARTDFRVIGLAV